MTTLEKIMAEIDYYLKNNEFGMEYRNDIKNIIDRYAEQEPKAKTGMWITDEPTVYKPYVCSECGHFYNLPTRNYCPKCGARMKTECDHPDKCHECEKILTCDYYKRGAK